MKFLLNCKFLCRAFILTLPTFNFLHLFTPFYASDIHDYIYNQIEWLDQFLLML